MYGISVVYLCCWSTSRGIRVQSLVCTCTLLLQSLTAVIKQTPLISSKSMHFATQFIAQWGTKAAHTKPNWDASWVLVCLEYCEKNHIYMREVITQHTCYWSSSTVTVSKKGEIISWAFESYCLESQHVQNSKVYVSGGFTLLSSVEGVLLTLSHK